MKKAVSGILLLLTLTVLAGCFGRAHRQEDFYFGSYSEAEALYSRKQYDKALQRYQAYIDENPEGNLAVIAQYYMAKCHAALGHTPEAKALFKKIMTEHPDLVWANFSEAQLKDLNKAENEAAKESKK